MKISELVEALEDLRGRLGDLNVVYFNTGLAEYQNVGGKENPVRLTGARQLIEVSVNG